MHSIEMQEEIRKISSKYSIKKEQVKELVYLMFKFVREVIRSADRYKGYFPVVRLMGIGIFFVSNSRKEKIKKKIQNDKNKTLHIK